MKKNNNNKLPWKSILMVRTNLSQKIDQLIASLKTYKKYNWLGWIQAWM